MTYSVQGGGQIILGADGNYYIQKGNSLQKINGLRIVQGGGSSTRIVPAPYVQPTIIRIPNPLVEDINIGNNEIGIMVSPQVFDGGTITYSGNGWSTTI